MVGMDGSECIEAVHASELVQTGLVMSCVGVLKKKVRERERER